jgi:acyl phosphate:glycerol-3-phosphate acyltransferase
VNDTLAVAIWHYPSGGVLTAFGLFPIIAVLVTGLIVIKHNGNIERLWKGTESRIGQRG